MKIIARVSILLMCLLMILPVVSSAARPYDSYTYDIDGDASKSPDAFVPERKINSTDIGMAFLGDVAMADPTDLFVDINQVIYIADPANNRIIILNPDGSPKMLLNTFVNDWGVPDSLEQPKGVFSDGKNIYVADTEKARIVVFGYDGTFERVIAKPEDDVFPEGAVYKPIAVAVDSTGRLYVVSQTTNQGIIAMNPLGEFQGFLGAQKVVPNMMEIFWRNFQTKEQRAQLTKNVSTEYNNITIDADGFIYVTTSSLDQQAQAEAVTTKAADYQPVKRLNPQGADVMMRTDHFAPSGEVSFVNSLLGDQTGPTGPSKIVDVAIGPDGMWSIIDQNRSKVYTYNEEGKLLVIFGDTGKQFGNTQRLTAIAYQDTKILLLDSLSNNILVMKRTEYGDILANALRNHRERRYDEAVNDWKEILKRNNNFDLAYIGIGKSLYRDSQFTEAMEQYKLAWDTANYSNAYKMYRKDWITKYVVVIPIIIFLVVFGVMKFMSNAAKVNQRDQIRKGRKLSLSSHMLYNFHIIFHPFDGFWDMKHEKRGSPLGALIYFALCCLVFFINGFASGYMVSGYSGGSNILLQVLALGVPVVLWCVANWCLTTLFDGEGSMKDIFMATCYSLLPVTICTAITTIMSHFIIQEEIAILTMITSFGFTWMGFLVFFGVMVVHDYTLGKNILTSVGTIGGMVFIMFFTALFSSLLMRMVSFVSNIVVEISYRM